MSDDVLAMLNAAPTGVYVGDDGSTIRELAIRKFGDDRERNRRQMRLLLAPFIRAGKVIAGRAIRCNTGGVHHGEIVYRAATRTRPRKRRT